MAKRAGSEEVRELSKFLGMFFERYMTDGKPIPPEVHPLRVLSEMAERAPQRALLGVKMAIGDCIEIARHWSSDRVKEADIALRAEGAPTLSEIRRRYSRRFAAIIVRGKIVDEAEYHLVAGIVSDSSTPPEQTVLLEVLLNNYASGQGR